ncbi:hypothetical protein [Sphingopyxis sp.]|uniref:hypothetical protein n=1 Tax=Sphingopyxis sp. TaxID=1908224 RepID=UPI002ED7FABD
MMIHRNESNRFGWLWTAVIEASAAAVAIHYAAPWNGKAALRGEGVPRDDRQACGA